MLLSVSLEIRTPHLPEHDRLIDWCTHINVLDLTNKLKSGINTPFVKPIRMEITAPRTVTLTVLAPLYSCENMWNHVLYIGSVLAKGFMGVLGVWCLTNHPDVIKQCVRLAGCDPGNKLIQIAHTNTLSYVHFNFNTSINTSFNFSSTSWTKTYTSINWLTERCG